MAFVVRHSRKTAGDRTGEVFELIDTNETVRAEVWPQLGFNCLQWQIRQPNGCWVNILYKAPDWEANPVPTRSGHPILFPFPGRLRDGTFHFEGRTFSLPKNDSTKQHAIHGFTPRNPWRVIDWKGGDDSAFVTGQFCLHLDLPDAIPFWPADFNLTVTYRLSATASVSKLWLRISAPATSHLVWDITPTSTSSTPMTRISAATSSKPT